VLFSTVLHDGSGGGRDQVQVVGLRLTRHVGEIVVAERVLLRIGPIGGNIIAFGARERAEVIVESVKAKRFSRTASTRRLPQTKRALPMGAAANYI
jgi:hypothetical protein